ncbi:non-canonical purine NTP pyrophosphatase [Haloplasma contractile]|uniref:Nucleoside-triphosphatase protein n=1 Tax=Haloplasma contractile SSD-17B TaxID=1033810 RepID=F7PU34_9MOLU|nr:non-canonical purine NTP pyrophosphatase [Haloplasma contractile]ERJ11789.1 nucleoside-triphosphatase protein [Haloplasma contractile SSD-17B]
MKFIYGTRNSAKIHSMRHTLKGMDIEIQGLGKLDLPPIIESGNTPLENARIKAVAYYNALKKPVFSCDSGLYLEEVALDKQPGVHVRRVNGKTLTDEEMITYYSNLAKTYGGKIRAHYQNAICLVINEDLIFQYDGNNLQSEPFYISSTPHKKRVNGFPLNSLSIDLSSGNYYMNLDSLRKDDHLENGFVQFFEQVKANLKTEQREL